MNTLAAFAAALALVAPAPTASVVRTSVAHEAATAAVQPQFGLARDEPRPFRELRESYRPQTLNQVRIEQRVIIRIAPSSPSTRDEIFAPPPREDRPVRFKEKKAEDCVPIDAIAGAAPMQPNKLLLFMRDHSVLSASLERECDAAAYYLGFYIERRADGKLCKNRDMLKARTGASCQVSRISRLVPQRR